MTMKDSWIWHVMPAGKGKMTDEEVNEWFDKCMLLIYLSVT